MVQNPCQKKGRKKNWKWPPRTHFWTPKSTKWGQSAPPHDSQIRKKLIFEGLIFWWFFGWPKKSFPGVTPLIDNTVWLGPGLPGGLGGTTKQPTKSEPIIQVAYGKISLRALLATISSGGWFAVNVKQRFVFPMPSWLENQSTNGVQVSSRTLQWFWRLEN